MTKDKELSHMIADIEKALTSGRWNDACPLLSDILVSGAQCELMPVEFYEGAAGQRCEDANVRFHLTSRLRMLADRYFCLNVRERATAGTDCGAREVDVI